MKGCRLPLVDVPLHLMVLNSQLIDRTILERPAIIEYCTALGFDEAMIHYHTPPCYPNSTQSRNADLDNFAIDEQDYDGISTSIWDSILPICFKKIQQPSIDPTTWFHTATNDPMGLFMKPSLLWPQVYASKLLTRAVDTINHLQMHRIVDPSVDLIVDSIVVVGGGVGPCVFESLTWPPPPSPKER